MCENHSYSADNGVLYIMVSEGIGLRLFDLLEYLYHRSFYAGGQGKTFYTASYGKIGIPSGIEKPEGIFLCDYSRELIHLLFCHGFSRIQQSVFS